MFSSIFISLPLMAFTGRKYFRRTTGWTRKAFWPLRKSWIADIFRKRFKTSQNTFLKSEMKRIFKTPSQNFLTFVNKQSKYVWTKVAWRVKSEIKKILKPQVRISEISVSTKIIELTDSLEMVCVKTSQDTFTFNFSQIVLKYQSFISIKLTSGKF